MTKPLLPCNATPFQRATEQANARIEFIPTRVADVKDPQKAPVQFLPFLAWEASVDEWDTQWDEETKRSVIAASPLVHRHKGTKGAVEKAVQAIGGGLVVEEWHEYNGQPYTFRVVIDGLDNLSQEQISQIIRVVQKTKNLRSQFEGIFSSQTLELTANYLTAAQTVLSSSVNPLSPQPESQTLSISTLAGSSTLATSTVHPANWIPVDQGQAFVSGSTIAAAAPSTNKAVTVYPSDVQVINIPDPTDPNAPNLPPIDPDAGPVIDTAAGATQLVGGAVAGVGGAVSGVGDTVTEVGGLLGG